MRGGPALSALLLFPTSVSTDTAGNVWWADRGNHLIRMVNVTTNITSTIVGVSGQHGYNGDGTLPIA